MSRSGYIDDADDNFAYGRWRQAVKRAIEGRRGQALLRDMTEALEAMEDKRLYAVGFATSAGEVCALGALGVRRGIRMDDLGDDDDCDPAEVGARFDIARAMAAEIMFMNDEHLVNEWPWVNVEICGPMRDSWRDQRVRNVRVHDDRHAEKRWQRMLDWAKNNLVENGNAA